MKQEYNNFFWRTGLEITPETFIQADNYNCYQQNLIRKIINREFYGLLPANSEDKQELTIKADLDDLKISIKQLCCRGITKEGFLIDFDDNLLSSAIKNTLSISDSPGKYYVVIRINPYEQVLMEPVENENAPFSHPAYELVIKKLTQIEGNELPVLKIVFDGNYPQIDQNYIPPCMSVLSHKRLLDYYLNCKQVCNEILTLLKHKKEQYGQFILPVSILILDIEHFSLSEPPYFLIQQFRKLLKAFGFCIKELQSNIENIINMPYNHNDIEEIFKSLTSCLNEILLIVGKEEVIEEDFTPQI